MSFAFIAVGTAPEIPGQLERTSIATGDGRFNEFGTELRDLIAKHFEAESVPVPADSEYRYVVKASGHGGGTAPLSLQLTIEPQWICLPAAEDPADEA